jgi:hypothetical protein
METIETTVSEIKRKAALKKLYFVKFLTDKKFKTLEIKNTTST